MTPFYGILTLNIDSIQSDNGIRRLKQSIFTHRDIERPQAHPFPLLNTKPCHIDFSNRGTDGRGMVYQIQQRNLHKTNSYCYRPGGDSTLTVHGHGRNTYASEAVYHESGTGRPILPTGTLKPSPPIRECRLQKLPVLT
jgi:hypothetical protein